MSNEFSAVAPSFFESWNQGSIRFVSRSTQLAQSALIVGELRVRFKPPNHAVYDSQDCGEIEITILAPLVACRPEKKRCALREGR